MFFDSSDYDGLDDGLDYVFGGRSFTVFRADETGLTEVYDSGSEFEAKTAEYIPENFNCSNDDKSIDDRSGKKGPEAESVTIGTVGEKTYAFVGLERIGGVMVYDITDPAEASFVNYINSRDFSEDIAGDDSPEGLCFIPASDSVDGNAYLLAACEVSGTIAAYELTENAAVDPGDGQKPGDDQKPDDGQNPGDDQKPDDTQNPGGAQDPAGGSQDPTGGNGSGTGTGSGSQSGKDAPKTGDYASPILYGVLIFAAAGTAGIMIRRRRSVR